MIQKTNLIFPENAATREYAQWLDAADPLRSFREKFIIPCKANVKTKRLAKAGSFGLLKHAGFLKSD
jgi:kynureninase